MSGGLLPPYEDTGSEAEYAYDESDDREQSSRRRDVLVLGIGRGEPQGLSVDPIRQLRGRRRLHRELGVVRVLDGVECRFGGGELLIHLLTLDRTGEVERVVARQRRDEPSAVVARGSQPRVGVEGGCEAQRHVFR